MPTLTNILRFLVCFGRKPIKKEETSAKQCRFLLYNYRSADRTLWQWGRWVIEFICGLAPYGMPRFLPLNVGGQKLLFVHKKNEFLIIQPQQWCLIILKRILYHTAEYPTGWLPRRGIRKTTLCVTHVSTQRGVRV